MRNTTFIYSIIGIYLFLNSAIPAAEPVQDLDDIVVSGTRSEQPGIRTSSSIRIITAEEIKNSGASHIIEILRNQGGIQISDLYGDGSRATISMRGFGGNAQANTLVLVDGRRLNNADLGVPDINSVSLKDVERIEIVRGSSGVLFGDQAVGGVINIITRRPGDFELDVNARYGSYNRRIADLRVSNRHDNGLGYRVSAEKSKTDNYRDNNEQDYTNLFGLVDFEHETGSLFFEYQDIDEELETPGTLFIDQVKADREQAFNPLDFQQTDTRNFRAGIVQEIWRSWQLQAEYTNRIAESDGLLSFGGVAGPFITKRDHREFTPRLTGTFDTANGEALITLGGDIFNTDFFLNSILGAIDNEQKQYAAYIQGVIPVLPDLILTTGARYAEVQNDITGALLPPNTEIDDNVNAFEAGLSYQANKNLRLFGRFDTNYRYVLADEYTSASFGGVIPDTQTGKSWEFGFDWAQSDFNFNFVFYHLTLEDEIDFDPILFINTNIGDTRRNGFIVDTSYYPTDKLSFGINFSYVNAKVENGPLADLAIPFVAKNTIRFVTGYQFADYLHGNAEILGISERVATGDFFNANPVLPGYVIGNLQLSFERGPVSLGFRVNNILDKEYSDNAQLGFRAPLFVPETTYFPAPERNYLLTFGYEFD